MYRHSLLTLTSVLVVALALAPGCRKKPPTTTPEPEKSAPAVEPVKPAPPPTKEPSEPFPTEPAPKGEEEITSVDVWNQRGVLHTIYFALDSSELTAEAQSTLRDNAEWLKSHANLNVVVEGHCDERGTIEYNLALGERRANTVRDYLVPLGVKRPRLRTVTFGEERPVELGHGETAWSKNRRAAFVLEE